MGIDGFQGLPEFHPDIRRVDRPGKQPGMAGRLLEMQGDTKSSGLDRLGRQFPLTEI
jgi:hypothetical protein